MNIGTLRLLYAYVGDRVWTGNTMLAWNQAPMPTQPEPLQARMSTWQKPGE